MAMVNVTLNPNDMSVGHVLSNKNLTDTTLKTHLAIRATHGKTTGKWYWEVKLNSGNVNMVIGVSNKVHSLDVGLVTGTTGEALNYRGFHAGNGNKYPEASTYGNAWVVGNIIGVALDLDNGTLEFYKNGVSMGVSHSNVKVVGEVFPFFKDQSNFTKTFTVNFGSSTFAYPIPTGYLAYGNEVVYKSLIFHANEYKKYSASSWQTITSTTPTESDYSDGNTVEEISLIPESAWQELTGTVELCYYTDDTSITEAQFSIETEPFTLADEFKGKEIKILEYTDNPSQVGSKVETEVEPYSIYDEFGDTMEVLYYTDDADKNKAELEITANYSPLDELEGDYEVVTWSNAVDEVTQESIPQITSDVVEEGTVYETPLNLENVVKVK